MKETVCVTRKTTESFMTVKLDATGLAPDYRKKIKNAGEILLGDYTPVTLCNFVLGPNAILPTGGFAKTYSSVSVMDFLKRSSVGYASREGFMRVREHASRIARVEGFDAHALAVEERSTEK